MESLIRIIDENANFLEETGETRVDTLSTEIKTSPLLKKNPSKKLDII